MAIPFPLLKLFLNVSAMYLGQAIMQIRAGVLHDLANPAALQGNVMWVAGLITTFSCDLRVLVGGSNAPLSRFAKCGRRRH